MPTEQAGPPYIAIVSNLTTWPGASPPPSLTYRVREASGTTGYDSTFTIAPTDTAILSVAPGSYLVDAIDVPTRCVLPRGGAKRGVVLTESDNTGVLRFSIECRGIVSVTALVSGAEPDREFIFRFRRTGAPEILGVLPANDTLVVAQATPGDYEVDIGGVAPNCTVTNDGGVTQRVRVVPTGGATVDYRIVCSAAAERPRILAFSSGYESGASIFQFRVYDPDKDLDGYTWDITDCQGNSVLPDKTERTRRGLSAGRGFGADSLTVVGAFEVGVLDELMVGRCTEIRVFDVKTNLSRIVVHRIGSAQGSPPVLRLFNAVLPDYTRVTSILEAQDPDSDIIGHFVLIRLRDGTLGARDGKLDLGYMDAAGFVGIVPRDIPLVSPSRVRWEDVYAVIVYLIDSQGNVVRREDPDVFR